MKYGYIRVSTREQNTGRQEDALKQYGIPQENIFVDRQSGKDFERPAYRKLLRKLKKNDLLIISSIDRLGRNYDEILVQWRTITKEIGADIMVLDMPLLNTCGMDEDAGLTRIFIADMVLQILAYVAQTEREFIRKRQKEGIESAKARGVRFGRPQMDKPEQFHRIYCRWKKEEITGREGARQLNVDLKTFQRWAEEENEQENAKENILK